MRMSKGKHERFATDAHHEVQCIVSCIVRQEDPHAAQLGHAVAAAGPEAAGRCRLEVAAISQAAQRAPAILIFGACPHQRSRHEVADVI